MSNGIVIVGLVIAAAGISRISTLRRRAAWRKAVRLEHGPFDPVTHCPRLDKHIATLVEAFGVDTFSAMPVELPNPSPSDRGEFLRTAVALAGSRFQVTLPTVDLQFAPPGSISHSGIIDGGGEIWKADHGPGGLALQPSGDAGYVWRIRIATEFRLNDAAILKIAAHEVAHLVLFRDNLDWQNEELVDTAIVLLGYGPLMRRFRSEEQVVHVGGRVHKVVCGPGYLHPDAIQYVWEQRQRLTQHESRARASQVEDL